MRPRGMGEATVTSELCCEVDFTPDQTANEGFRGESRFRFSIPGLDEERGNEIGEDEDGDLLLPRSRPKEFCISVRQSTRTPLARVGEQVWRGALYLADFLVSRGEALTDGVLLELGAGTGLTSVVAAALGARHVVATDVDVGTILEQCRANVEGNSSLLRGEIEVLGLDWTRPVEDQISLWPKDTREKLDSLRFIIAADVVYHNELTEAFMGTVTALFSLYPSIKAAFIALEKRQVPCHASFSPIRSQYVFTVEELDTVAPMYEYFVSLVRKLKGLKASVIEDEFQQFFCYQRTKELVLWKIER
ncbi:unnamed protein product [Darwinula stevensoni]|uniref:Methyltransferase-like protein 22 n=1 Tax=Darwinula stevensoni TaxID=69355 RepID=A0A7R8X5B1_9CRUS|nr:unnamed protein product [Darwinula stevensoni]CAG0880720.1 unnamed protein product [Darwinula stevensoni]